jgi:antitoxin component of RelBE/YafQ-DinJ toxin-antitoxin module
MDKELKRELKKEDINIRIENSVKQEFKKLCSTKNTTMSKRIMQLIIEEIKREKN